MPPKTIALTGATGFVGAAITDMLLSHGHQVIALARTPSKLHRPNEVSIIKGELSDPTALKSLSEPADIMVHCAGLTHALRNQDFTTINVEGASLTARIFAETHHQNTAKKFLHISSLAARQPHISAYAGSKYASEKAVETAIDTSTTGIEWITLRAPAMYGPRDEATLPFFKSVKRGIAPIPGGRGSRRASILYVEDFARAVYTAMTQAPSNRLYEVGDNNPDGHSWAQIADACSNALGVKSRKLALPKPFLSAWASSSSTVIRALGRPPMVTRDKIEEFFHPDWAARDNLLSDHTSWRPQISLASGFSKTVIWYQEEGLL